MDEERNGRKEKKRVEDKVEAEEEVEGREKEGQILSLPPTS